MLHFTCLFPIENKLNKWEKTRSNSVTSLATKICVCLFVHSFICLCLLVTLVTLTIHLLFVVH